jgi:hypothetical protein
MKNSDDVYQLALEKSKKFIKDLDGRFQLHVSDLFLAQYLSMKFESVYMQEQHDRGDEPNAKNVAYQVSCWLFESVLEHGCETGGNGHHVAQQFASFFEEF